MTKKVLLVTYHYPPILSAGVSRLLGVSRYLAANGWDVTVVTIRRAYAELSDEATLDQIPESITVERTGTLEIDRFNPRLLLESRSCEEAREVRDAPGTRKLLAAILRYPYALLHPLGSYPERQVGWIPPLFGELKRLLSENRYDVVMSSSPPHSLHLALLALKKMRRFRWVTDFRDPWSAPPHYGKSSPIMPVTRRVEKLVLNACDHVITNTKGNRRELLAAFPSIDSTRVSIVTNGFDIRESIGRATPDEVDCDFIYTGEIYEGMLDLYIQALSHLRGNGIEPLPRLYLYGYIDKRSSRMIADFGLEEAVVFKGRVDRDKSMALMRSARALLLMVAHNQRGASWVPSKLYAYLFSDRPVLAIVPAGDAEDLIAETGAGRSITSRDPEKVAAGVHAFVTAVRSGTLSCNRNEQVIERYTMDSIGNQIERILLEQVDRSP